MLNTAAVAAARALAADPAARVAVVDFDVHHGNGTEAWVRAGGGGGRALYASVHAYEVGDDPDFDFFPGTGAPERGAGVVNVAVAPNWARPGARDRFLEGVDGLATALRKFAPTLVIFSAGFDACRGDAGQETPPDVESAEVDGVGLEPADYGDLTRRLMEAAGPVPVVSCLEGGYGRYAPPTYDRRDLAASVLAHVAALRERPP